MRNGTQMKKKLSVQWTASEWQLWPRLAWTSGPREHGVDDACETAKPQQDSSPRGGPKRSRMRRQGVPNPTFEPVKNTRTWASAGMLHPTFKPYTDTIITAPSAALPKRRNTNGVPHPTFEPLRNTSTRASATHAKRHPDEEKVNRAVDGKWMAASASVGLNFRAPRTWSGRCMRNSETPAGFKPKRWPKKVPNATPRVCLTRPSNPLKTLGPEPRLVCFIQRSNPMTLLPHPRQHVQNGETPRCASAPSNRWETLL